MWGSTETFGGAVGGGFMNNISSPSTSGKGDKATRKGANLFPVTIRQLHESPDETLKFGEIEVNTLTVVGIIRRVEISTTKVSYVVDDHTGSIEAIVYVGPEDNASDPPIILSEGAYGRIIGSLRAQRGDGQKYILIYKVFPVVDLNEVTCHNLEVIYVPLKLKMLKDMEDKKSGYVASGDGGFGSSSSTNNNSYSNTMVGGGLVTNSAGTKVTSTPAADGAPSGFKPVENKVLAYIKAAQGNEGVHKDQIAAMLRLPPQQVRDILDSLGGEGHIYSTKDDDHFKITE